MNIYYGRLIAAMGNPHAAEAWLAACELDAECAALVGKLCDVTESNAGLRDSQLRWKIWLEDVQHALSEAREANRRIGEHCDQAIDAGHEAGIALLREQARSRIARRNALNYGLGLLCVLSAIVIGILAGALMVL